MTFGIFIAVILTLRQIPGTIYNRIGHHPAGIIDIIKLKELGICRVVDRNFDRASFQCCSTGKRSKPRRTHTISCRIRAITYANSIRPARPINSAHFCHCFPNNDPIFFFWIITVNYEITIVLKRQSSQIYRTEIRRNERSSIVLDHSSVILEHSESVSICGFPITTCVIENQFRGVWEAVLTIIGN